MQGKLRLKAHKLWSHLVVSFKKTATKFPASVCLQRTLFIIEKYMHHFLN